MAAFMGGVHRLWSRTCIRPPVLMGPVRVARGEEDIGSGAASVRPEKNKQKKHIYYTVYYRFYVLHSLAQ